MSKLFQRLTAALICTAIIGTLMAGCGTKNEEKVEKSSEPNKSAQASELTKEPAKDVTLTYWVVLNTNVSTTSPTLNETEFAKQMEKDTGIKVKYIHPTMGQSKEQFNLMLASKDLPDIIEYEWLSFIGGPELAIKDGYIIKLNDVIDKNAPNLKKVIEQDVEVSQKAKTDNGNYFMFPFIRGNEKLMVFHGPMLRNDWLKELNLPVPTTIDEWTTTLTAFKTKKGATAPLSYQKESNPKVGTLAWGTFVGAYGVPRDYFIDNGKIKYGPIEPGFKDFLGLFNKWYTEGLLDKNFATVDAKILDANMTSGKSGAAVSYNGGGLGKWMQAMKAKEPNYELVAAPYPVLKKGDVPGFGQMDNKVQGNGAAITTMCKNVDVAAKLLDYGYSEKGIKLYNFGIENVSYTMVDGKPKYTDLITKNPDKLTLSQAMAQHMRTYSGPFIQQKEYIDNFYAFEQQKDALATWSKTDAAKHVIPPIYPMSEESSELAKIENEIDTYVDEMFYKFVMGAEPLTNFDKYVEQVKKLNVDRAIQIKQAALERYLKR